MSDINLLPTEHHHKDLEEQKSKEEEKKKVTIDLTDPQVVQKNSEEQKIAYKKQGFFSVFKNLFKKDKEVKKEPVQHKPKQEQKVEVKDLSSQKQSQPEKDGDLVWHLPEKKSITTGISMDAVSQKQERSPEKKEVNQKQDFYKKDEHNKEREENQGQNKEKEMKFSKGNAPLNKESIIDVNLMPSQKKEIKINYKTKITSLIIIFVVCLLLFGGIFIWLSMETNRYMDKVKSFDNLIEDVKKQAADLEEIKQQSDILKSHLEKLSQIIAGHSQTNKIFNYIEENTVPGIYYSVMSLEAGQNLLSLSGEALDYTQAAKQILAFKEDKQNIKNVNIVSLSLEKEKNTEDEESVRRLVIFDLSIEFVEGFLTIEDVSLKED